MTIQPISAASTVLYLTPADLLERGFSADKLTEKEILELTQNVLYQAGQSPSAPLEIEVYSDPCGLLVFVHIDNEVWIFRDFEVLLTAVLSLDHDHTDGLLYWWRDAYWLVLPGQNIKANAILSEFGISGSADPYITSKLEEYGTLILDHHARKTLSHHFNQKKRELP